MKIVMIDKYFFVKGGAERYLFELSKILRENGHDVIPFSMKHRNNAVTPFDGFFVDNIEYNLDSLWEKAKNSFRITSRMLYSFHAKERLEKLICHVKPDIAHVHMIDHQLSPSILHTLKKYKIPVLQTVHQYKLVCPNYRLYNMRTNRICEKCLSGQYYHPIFARCHKNSSFAGLLIAAEASLHRAMKIYEKNIDLFHVPSRFMGTKLRQGGINTKKIEHLFYTIALKDYPMHLDSDNYFVYVGRLAREKGVLTLLKAMRKVFLSHLVIIGEGPQRAELEHFVSRNRLSNVTFVGLKRETELKSLMSKSKFVIVPSEWYDNSPLVIYESFAFGKPVIGSDVGGIPELIDHENTGLLFNAGDSEMLADRIHFFLNSPKRIRRFGIRAREMAEREFSPQFHYNEIYKKYTSLLSK